MSEEQLAALLAKLKDDAGLREKLQGAGDLDAAMALAKDAGFDVSQADWRREETLELSEEDLEGVSGGGASLLLWRDLPFSKIYVPTVASYFFNNSKSNYNTLQYLAPFSQKINYFQEELGGCFVKKC